MPKPDFLPYGRQTIEPDDVEAVLEVLRGSLLTTGPRLEGFEAALAEAVGARAAVAVSSGTAALHAACFAAGVGEGDEVTVPALTFVATANCARFLGAEPVLADVDPDTGLLLPQEVERRNGPKTRAVVPVHLNGTPADLSAIASVAASVGARVIEDATHALGATHEGRPVGSCPAPESMAVFSFHPVKTVTTGEGGAITVDDPDLLRELRAFRNHGIVREPERLRHESPGPWYYEQQALGHNLRMTELQAALGISQLRKLARFVQRRRVLAGRYDRLLSELPGVVPVTRPERAARSAYHLYAVLIDFAVLGLRRSDLMLKLRERGIGTQVHYIPLPLHPYYQDRGWRIEDFPGASAYYERVLSLPLFPGMADADVDRVVSALSELLREPGRSRE